MGASGRPGIGNPVAMKPRSRKGPSPPRSWSTSVRPTAASRNQIGHPTRAAGRHQRDRSGGRRNPCLRSGLPHCSAPLVPWPAPWSSFLTSRNTRRQISAAIWRDAGLAAELGRSSNGGGPFPAIASVDYGAARNVSISATALRVARKVRRRARTSPTGLQLAEKYERL